MAYLIPENLRGRADVASAMKRVARALKVGLGDDAIVWFEPLYDPTAEKPHFVALIPDNGIAVLEVLDVRASNLLGVLRGKLRIERDGREVEVDQPVQRAERFVDEIRKRIAAEAQLADLTIPAGAAAVFPSLTRDAAEQRGLSSLTGLDAGRCLFRDDVEAAVAGEDLDRWFARLLGAATPIEGDLVDLVRGVIQPNIRIDDGQLTILRAPEGAEVVRMMDIKQESLAKGLGEGHRVVRGVAGSGKTVILVARAKLFASLYPDRRFLLTCYTKSLASELRRALEDYENVEVRTLDWLVTKAIGEAGLTAPGYDVEGGEARAAVGVAALEKGALARYRAVFVDEAQDFGTERLRFAVKLADDRFNDVLIVADNAQKVFKRRASWKQAGVQAQGRTRILTRNYRNTREILELAHALVPSSQTNGDAPDPEDENIIVPPEAAMRGGAVPTLHVRDGDGPKHAVACALQMLSDRARPKEVAILYVTGKEGKQLAETLRNAGVDFFDVNDPQRPNNDTLLGTAEERVVLSTVYKAKGLEFPSVVLCCTPRDEIEVEQLRSALYVGMTRATERLHVVVERDHPLVDDLRTAAASSGRIDLANPADN